MRWSLLIVSVFFLSCHRNRECTTTLDITNSAPGCGGWGIVVGGVKYPSRNIPDEFKHDGLQVCVEYDIYDDYAMCACCGGKWANIHSMKMPTD